MTSRAEHQVDHRADHKVGNPPFNDPSSQREGVGSLNGGLFTLWSEWRLFIPARAAILLQGSVIGVLQNTCLSSQLSQRSGRICDRGAQKGTSHTSAVTTKWPDL